MAQKYASKQPQGYRNHVEKIAIVGVGGQVGSFIVAELLKTGKHKVTAITRVESTSTVPEGVEVQKVDYGNPDSLVSALRGQEVLVITMGVFAPRDQQSKLIDAAAAAGVPWVIPNEWGTDNGNNPKLAADTMIGPGQMAIREQIDKLGKSAWISICCSFWYEFSLSGGEERFGFDFKNKTLTLFDEGTTRINTSTWPQCGRAVAKLLSLKILPEDEGDKSAHLAQFTRKPVYVSSFLISQKDMLQSVLRVTGASEADWKLSRESSKERFEAGTKAMQAGNMAGFAKMLYSRVFYPDGSGDYETSMGLHNDVLGLPKEDLDEATKVAVQIAEKGDQSSKYVTEASTREHSVAGHLS